MSLPIYEGNIIDYGQLGEYVDVAFLCVRGDGRSPQNAYFLEQMFRAQSELSIFAVAVEGGLLHLASQNNDVVQRYLSLPMFVVACISPKEAQQYAGVINKITRGRTRGVEIGEAGCVVGKVLEAKQERGW